MSRSKHSPGRAVLCLALAALAGAVCAESTRDLSVEELIERVESKEGGVRPQGDRSTAIRELMRREDPAGAAALLEVLADSYVHQREVVMLAIAKCQNPTYVEGLLGLALRHKDEVVRANMAQAIGIGKLAELGDRVAEMRRDRSPLVRQEVAFALGELARATEVEALEELAGDRDAGVRRATARAILSAALPETLELAIQLAGDRDADVNSLALEAIAAIDPAAAAERLTEAAAHRDEVVRIGALLGQRRLGQSSDLQRFETAVTASIAALEDPSWRVRATAMENAIELWDERFIAPLVARMKKEDGRLRLDCAFALTLLCDYDLGTDAEGWASWWQAQEKSFEMPEQPKRGKYGFERRLAASEGSSSFFDIPVMSKRCIFQFDFSGSMARELEDYRKDSRRSVSADEKTTVTKLEIAQDEAEAVVDKLARDAAFNFQIHRYIGARNPPPEEMEKAFKGLTPVSARSAATAKKWVRSRQVDGWGAFYTALVGAMEDDDVDTIFLLTDGVPSGGERVDDDRFIQGILEHDRTRRITIHAILLKNNDEGHNKYAVPFMENLAAATGGLCVLR